MGLRAYIRNRLRSKPSFCCLDCGFLGLTQARLVQDYPIDIKSSAALIEYWRLLETNDELTLEDRQHNVTTQWLFCQRRIAHPPDIFRRINLTHEERLSLLMEKRNCRYFFPYTPGFNPKEHLQLEQQHRTNDMVRNATILGAIVGAAAAIIAGVVTVVLARYLD